MAGLYDSQRNLLDDLQTVLRRMRACEGLAEDRQPFGRVGDAIVLIQPVRLAAFDTAREIEESAWAEIARGRAVGPRADETPEDANSLDELLRHVREKSFLTGEQRVGRGGVAVALALACATEGYGFDVELTENDGVDPVHALFGEWDGRVIVACRASAHLALTNRVDRSAHFSAEMIGRITQDDVCVRWMGDTVLREHARVLIDILSS